MRDVVDMLKDGVKSVWGWISVLALLVLWVVVWLVKLPDDTSQILNSLGVMSGALATVLVLVLTIILVAPQLTGEYVRRVRSRVFFWPTFLYVLFFIVIVMYSLALALEFRFSVVSTRFWQFQVRVVFALTGTVLLLLLPFFRLIVVYRLSPSRMMEDLAAEGVRSIEEDTT